MINEFKYPDFPNSLVNIPHTILEHFGVDHQESSLGQALDCIKGCSQIILFIADGFGQNLLANKESNIFTRMSQSGYAQELTTVFPSATPPALTTLNTGLLPREHGLLEWNMYSRELGMIIETMPYEQADAPEGRGESLPRHPEILFDGTTIYERLALKGVKSFYFVAHPYHTSVYTEATSRGATVYSYSSLGNLMSQLREKLQDCRGEAYYYVHWAGIDAAEHTFGVEADEVRAEIDSLSNSLDHELFKKISPSISSKTAFILTADHGQITVDPATTIYLNQYSEITEHLKRAESGKQILPSGGARDVTLTIEEEYVDKVTSFLQKKLQGIADVIKLDANARNAFFGEGESHPEFVNRLGNILVLPQGNNLIWYEYCPGKRLTEYGDHGGLTRDEMSIPFIATRIDRLRETI